MEKYKKYLLTGAVVLLAVVVVLLKYWDYVTNPWTRDGQVRAQVIQITPRVSGPIVKLPIKDNQRRTYPHCSARTVTTARKAAVSQ